MNKAKILGLLTKKRKVVAIAIVFLFVSVLAMQLYSPDTPEVGFGPSETLPAEDSMIIVEEPTTEDQMAMVASLAFMGPIRQAIKPCLRSATA